MSGIEVESGLTQRWKCRKLWYMYCQLAYMHVRPGQCTNAMSKNWTISTEENSLRSGVKTRTRSAAGMQSLRTFLKLAHLRWTGHVTRMPDERLPKNGLLWRTSGEEALPRWPDETSLRHPKFSLKDFNIPPEPWEQIAQGRANWRSLVRKGAYGYQAKRVCEAERKRKERKARAKGSSSKSSFPELTCSV